MTDDLVTWFQQSIQTEIFGGLALVSLMGYAMFVVRNVPMQCYNLFIRIYTVRFEVRSDDQMFHVVAQWLARQSFLQSSRRLKLITRTKNNNRPEVAVEEDQVGDDWVFIPAPGYHYFWYKSHVVLLHINDGEEKGTSGSRQFMIIENIQMRTLGRNPSIFKEMLSEAMATTKEEFRVKVYSSSSYDYWNCPQRKLPRPISSIVTADSIADKLLQEMRLFLENAKWYTDRGIPWRRGYLFCGPPGTGKSSLVFALASELMLPIYSLSLGSKLTDNSLISLLTSIPEKAVLLVEDIDTFSVAETRTDAKKSKKGLSLSGLLNALDGVTASEGRIVVMTTNHADKLDPALVRAGRIDRTVQLDYFSPEESRQMFNLFFDDYELETDAIPAVIQPAKLQEHLITYKSDPEWAATTLSSISC